MLWKIIADEIETGKRFFCFTWTRDPQDGIERAKRDAKVFGMDGKLTNFRAEPSNG